MANSVEEAIYTYLTADSTLMGEVDAVYWLEPDLQTYPYVVYWLVDDNGEATYIGARKQGQARIQFDLWDANKIRGARVRTTLRNSVNALNETVGGYTLRTDGITEVTVPREDGQSPYHFVVDGVITWRS